MSRVSAKMIGFLALALSLVAESGFSQEKVFTVAGVVRFRHNGDVCVLLVEAGTFQSNGSPVRQITIHPTAEETKAGAVRFAFEGVSADEYGIKAFVDVNGNGIHDKGLFGIPLEPWGMSWRGEKPFGFPKFADMSFQLLGNTTINITVE